MPLALGSNAISLKLGSQSVIAYLGEQLVTATVPGKPTIVSAESINDPEAGIETVVVFTAPAGEVTGYRFWFEGVLLEPDSLVVEAGTGTARFSFGGGEQELIVAAFNDAGEGPQSDPVTVA